MKWNEVNCSETTSKIGRGCMNVWFILLLFHVVVQVKTIPTVQCNKGKTKQLYSEGSAHTKVSYTLIIFMCDCVFDRHQERNGHCDREIDKCNSFRWLDSGVQHYMKWQIKKIVYGIKGTAAESGQQMEKCWADKSPKWECFSNKRCNQGFMPRAQGHHKGQYQFAWDPALYKKIWYSGLLVFPVESTHTLDTTIVAA